MSDEGRRLLTTLSNDSEISGRLTYLLYQKAQLDISDITFLQSTAVVLMTEYERNGQYLLIRYAYQILVLVARRTGYYEGLSDAALRLGFFPVVEKINQIELLQRNANSFQKYFTSDQIKKIRLEGHSVTQEQWNIFNDILENPRNKTVLIAPTSYGKSELIYKLIDRNPEGISAIVVPTRALLHQVLVEVKDRFPNRKVVTNYQNVKLDTDHNFIIVGTQERVLQFVIAGFVLDNLFIDEAHEIFEFDYGRALTNRSLVTIRTIKLAENRNPNLREYYFSPVIENPENLQIEQGNLPKSYRIRKDMKVWEIYFYQANGQMEVYDQFLGKFVSGKTYDGHFSFIVDNSHKKNLHFLYRPRFIEAYAGDLFDALPFVENPSRELLDLINELKSEFNDEFNVAKFLKKGILYLHGSIPNSIRQYLLLKFRQIDEIQHLVANSVVLAGMNLPIDGIFYISGGGNMAELKNLIGRVNRLNEVFEPSVLNIDKLVVPVHFVEIQEFPQYKGGSLRSKIEKLRSKSNDRVNNPTLSAANPTESQREPAKEIRRQERIFIDSISQSGVLAALTKSGAQSFLNFTSDGVKKLEVKLESKSSPEDMMGKIYYYFFDMMEYNKDYKPDFNIGRLNNVAARAYYAHFIENASRFPMNKRIEGMIKSWQKHDVDENFLIYVGPSFGEVERESPNYGGRPNRVYVPFNNHRSDYNYLVNLSIVKLQIDEDFVDFQIGTLVEALFTLGAISQDEYNYYIYGTTDLVGINLMQAGMTLNVYNFLKQNDQLSNVTQDDFGNYVVNEDLKAFVDQLTGIKRFEIGQIFNL